LKRDWAGTTTAPSELAAFARNPKPVGQDQIGRVPLDGDFLGFGRSKLRDFEIEIGFFIKAVLFNDRELPGKSAGLLHRKAYLVGSLGRKAHR
jgi:hypothetical protein